jgi:hypothetical protein
MCDPGSGWNVIQIKAWETPNFTDEIISPDPKEDEAIKAELISKIWVKERERKWGKKSFMYISNVEAEFPENAIDGLIPIAWIRRAQAKVIEPEGVSELGVDVGGGHDKSTIGHRHGGRFRIIHRDQNPDTMQTCGEVVSRMLEVKAESVKVDSIGIGKGLADRGMELKHPFHAVNVASRPSEPIIQVQRGNKPARQLDMSNVNRFVNLRAEGYWHIREIFEADEIDIDPEDEDLAEQLGELRFFKTSAGKIQIEAKEDMVKRLGHSPDDADCCMLAYLILPTTRPRQGATWGKHR